MNIPSLIVIVVVVALAAWALRSISKGRRQCITDQKAKQGCEGCKADCPLKELNDKRFSH